MDANGSRHGQHRTVTGGHLKVPSNNKNGSNETAWRERERHRRGKGRGEITAEKTKENVTAD